MLDQKGFDLWADRYDESVGLSDEDGTYPFAGYKKVLGEIYREVLSARAENVLDLGFGTGTLTVRLYERGCRIWGQDFSEKMIALAKEKMPRAHLFQGDLSKGLVEELKGRKYDAIISTYALHHLTDGEKVALIRQLRPLLSDNGMIYIGDIAFQTRAELESCRRKSGGDWDGDEIYLVYEELRQRLENSTFTRFSHCAGLLRLGR